MQKALHHWSWRRGEPGEESGEKRERGPRFLAEVLEVTVALAGAQVAARHPTLTGPPA